jgi:hypothetical protein
MSGLVSGLGKVFTAVGSGVARIGQAVKGVASTVFTAGAATGSVGAAAQGASGVLGTILNGALKQAVGGALIGGAVGALTGTGFGKGMLIGGLGGALSGGLSAAAGLGGPQALSGNSPPAPSVPGIASAATPTGVAPTGVTGPAAASPAGGALAAAGHMPVAGSAIAAAPAAGGGFMNFLKSETGGQLIAGLGTGLGKFLEAKERRDEAQRDRDFLEAKEQRLRDSYSVDPSALAGNTPAPPSVSRPTPAQKYRRTRYQYDPSVGMIVPVTA